MYVMMRSKNLEDEVNVDLGEKDGDTELIQTDMWEDFAEDGIPEEEEEIIGMIILHGR